MSASSHVDQKILGGPIELPTSKLIAKSRFLKGAMTERLASWDQYDTGKRGMPNEKLVRLYEEWVKRGFGIILTGNVVVTTVDLEASGNMIMNEPWESPKFLETYVYRVAKAAKAHGSLAIGQLSHAGRQVWDAINPIPVSAGDVQLPPTFGMTFQPEECRVVCARLEEMGLDFVELSGGTMEV